MKEKQDRLKLELESLKDINRDLTEQIEITNRQLQQLEDLHRALEEQRNRMKKPDTR